MVLLIIVAIVSSIASYVIAKSKNRNALAWGFAALLFSVIPLLIIALIPTIGKKCPQCAGTVQPEARVCRFCGYKFPPGLNGL